MTAKAEAKRPPLDIASTIVSGVWLITYIAALTWVVHGFGGALWGILFLLFALPLLRFASTVIHEAGHVLGAILSGWRPFVISAWPVAYHLSNNAVVLFGKGGGYDGGGYVASVPRAARHNTRLRYGIVVALGPIISLVAAIGFFAAASLPTDTFPSNPNTRLPVSAPSPLTYPEYPEVRMKEVTIIDTSSRVDLHQPFVGTMMALGFLSLGCFAATIIPWSTRDGDTSDGQKLLQLMLAQHRERLSAKVHMYFLLAYNVRLRDLPAWMVEASRAEAAAKAETLRHDDGVDIGRTLDAEAADIARAKAQVKAFRAAYGADDWLCSIDAWIAAVYEGDADRAAAALAARPGEVSDTPMLAAAEAAIAACTGDTKLLARKLDEMEARLHRDNPFPNPTFTDIRRQIEAVARQQTVA
jgi:hypothetical protein